MKPTLVLASRENRRPARRREAALVLLLVACVASAWGCASPKWVAVREVPRNPLTQQLNLLSRGGPKPTPRTAQLLRRYDLEGDLNGDPHALLAKLEKALHEEPTAEKTYAVSELAYLSAKKLEKTDEKVALDLYGTSVLHAYIYLFDPRFAEMRNPYDPQYRGASNLYNTALESALRIVRKQGVLQPGCTHTISTASRQFDVTVVVRGTHWRTEDFDRFEFVSDYNLEGLKNHHRNFGLGVPLIAIRKNQPGRTETERFYPPNLSFPVTAFLRINRSAAVQTASATDGPARLQAVLELHDPLVSNDIHVAGRTVPLENDLSTPLAYFLSQPEFDDSKIATAGLLNPEKSRGLTGMYMLEPYQPGKIPVVMVHGLWSSPVTWMEMFNDLRAAPELRRDYQFWFYLYPTGKPFWFSAAQMREDLAQVRKAVDPHRQEPALDQTVLVGHSMGGLVSKLQTLESGNEFWKIVSDQPVERVKAEPEVRQTLVNTLYFQPSVSVRRVITIGTPHRGSHVANSATRWLFGKLIDMPQKLLSGRQQLLRDNPGLFRESTLLDINTSIDSLAPDSPFLPAMLSARPAPWVKYHNIIGTVEEDSFLYRVSGSSDGVVSVESARLDEAVSQIMVPASHSNIHRHPRSILEVRRILLEHLTDLRSRPYGRANHYSAVNDGRGQY